MMCRRKGLPVILDIDGDGVGYRTLPGNEHPLGAWFARGTGHNEKAVYSEKSEDWLNNMARLERKFDTARKLVPAPVVDHVDEAKIGIIAYGTTIFAIDEARDRLAVDGVWNQLYALACLAHKRICEGICGAARPCVCGGAES